MLEVETKGGGFISEILSVYLSVYPLSGCVVIVLVVSDGIGYPLAFRLFISATIHLLPGPARSQQAFVGPAGRSLGSGRRAAREEL